MWMCWVVEERYKSNLWLLLDIISMTVRRIHLQQCCSAWEHVCRDKQLIRVLDARSSHLTWKLMLSICPLYLFPFFLKHTSNFFLYLHKYKRIISPISFYAEDSLLGQQDLLNLLNLMICFCINKKNKEIFKKSYSRVDKIKRRKHEDWTNSTLTNINYKNWKQLFSQFRWLKLQDFLPDFFFVTI